LANCLLAVAFVCWLAALARGEVRWRSSALYLPLAAYVLATLAAVVFSQDPGHSLREIGELLTLAVVPMVVSLVDRPLWDRLLAGLSAVAVISSGVGLWQYLHGASSLDERLRGVTNHYMTFSGWTLVVTLLLVGDMAFNPRRRRLLWTSPAFALCSTALLLSYTRNAWVGLAVGLVLVAAVWRPNALYVYPLAAALVVAALPRTVEQRLLSIFDPAQASSYDRVCMVISGVEMVQDHPLFGVGMGMVGPSYQAYRVADAPRQRVPHLHNNLLQISAERGLVGVASYLAILVVFAVPTWLAMRRSRQPHFAALAGCFVAVAGVTVAGLFEYNWGDAEVWIVTLLALSVPSALAEGAEEPDQGSSEEER
jgi:O-antigen ligase